MQREQPRTRVRRLAGLQPAWQSLTVSLTAPGLLPVVPAAGPLTCQALTHFLAPCPSLLLFLYIEKPRSFITEGGGGPPSGIARRRRRAHVGEALP